MATLKKASKFIDNIDVKLSKFMNYVNNSNIIKETDLIFSERYSQKFGGNVFMKREDTQSVRSFKIRGAYCKIMNYLTENGLLDEDNTCKSLDFSDKPIIVTASAGNHAQGVALTANKLGLRNKTFVPINTPSQKISRIKHFATNNSMITDSLFSLESVGVTFDESLHAALDYCDKVGGIFIHPFDDYDVIMGQSTISQEIYSQLNDIKPDYIVCTVGGGGLISGIGLHSKMINESCKIIGVEPEGANALEISMKLNKLIELDDLNTFVDGASVKKIGYKNFELITKSNLVDNVFNISNEEICSELIDMYMNEGYILEPAGVMGVAILDRLSKIYDFKNKNIVTILCGGNNDISRYPEMTELALKFKGLKHYFLVNFAQSPGELKRFVNNVLSETDDITRFEYLKRTNKEYGTVLIGVQTQKPKDVDKIMNNMDRLGFKYTKMEPEGQLYSHLI